MTVKDFEDKRREAARIREDLKKGSDAIAKVFGILQDKKTRIPDATMDLVRPELNQAIMAANAAAQELLRYEDLLDGIARTTELDWPPRCGKARK